MHAHLHIYIYIYILSLELMWKRDQFEIEMFKKQKVKVTDCPSLSERLSIMSKFVMYNQKNIVTDHGTECQCVLHNVYLKVSCVRVFL